MLLPNNERELINVVQQQLREAEKNKLARMAVTQLSENQYEGTQWYRFSRQFGYIYRDDEIMEGMILNYIRYCVDLAHSALTSTSYIPEAYSLTNTPSLNRSSKVGTVVLKDIFERNGGVARQKYIAKTFMIRGDHFVKLEIDDNLLDSLVLPQDQLQQFINLSGLQPITVEPASDTEYRAVFRLGHIVERDISSNHVVIPNGVEHFKDTPWFSVTHYMPLSQVQAFCEKMGADPEKVKPARIRDIRSLNMSQEFATVQSSYTYEVREDAVDGSTFTEKSNIAVMTEFWNKESDGTWTCLYFANINRDHYMGGEPGIIEHPYIHYGCWDRPGKFWSMPHTTDLIQIQRTINKLASVQLRHFIKSAKDIIFVPKGSRLVSIDAKEGTSIVEYSALTGHAPQFVSVGSSIMQQLTELLGMYEGKMLQLSRVSEAMQGDVPDRVSQGTMTMAYNQDRSTLGYLASKFEQAEREKWKKSLEIVRNSPNFNLPRLASMLGSDNRPLAMEWKNSDLSAHLMINAKPSSSSPETLAERTARSMELWGLGFFQPQMAEARALFNEYVDSGQTPAPDDDMQKYAEMQALEENQLIQTGQVQIVPIVQVTGPQQDKEMNKISIMVSSVSGRPLVQPWQNHAAHLEVLDELIQNPSTPEQIRQLAVFHQAEHQREMAAAQAQAAQSMYNDLSQQSIANAAGPILNTTISANTKPKSSPSGGGKASGVTRRKK